MAITLITNIVISSIITIIVIAPLVFLAYYLYFKYKMKKYITKEDIEELLNGKRTGEDKEGKS